MNRINKIEEAPEYYDLCGQIIGLAMKVHSALGPGFLESVYQKALIWELRKSGFRSEVQLVNYLTATGLNEGLLLNFGAERLEFKKKFRLPKTESPNSEIIL